MNKRLLSGMVLAVLAIALATTGVVHAQSGTTSTTVDIAYGMGGQGGQGGMMGGGSQDGLLHDEMIAVFAEKLGLTVEDLEARLTSGETLYDISIAEGLTVDEFTALMTEARNQAIDQAVADGTLTQTQADWMKSRTERMGTGNNGTRGTGRRGQSGTGTCMNP